MVKTTSATHVRVTAYGDTKRRGIANRPSISDMTRILLLAAAIVAVGTSTSDARPRPDRGKKFENYRQIPSLKEYLLVSQREPRIEQFVRQSSGDWSLKEAASLGAQIQLPALGIVLRLSEIFAKVQFTPARLRTNT